VSVVQQQQQHAMALGDFLVFLTRIASVPKLRQKMSATKWTSSLLKTVGYNADTGKFHFSKLLILILWVNSTFCASYVLLVFICARC